MKQPCVRCARMRWTIARGLCGSCHRYHRDEHRTLRSGQSPFTCECASPKIVPVGGVWDSFGATVCDHCQRPRFTEAVL